MNQLIRQIQSGVDPSSWQAIGPGTIREADNHDQLIVAQTPPNQQAVWQLLQEMRAQRGIQISVECRFIRDHAAFDALAESPGESWNICITDQEREDLLRTVQNSPNGTMITAPRVTLFNGQRAYVLVSTSQAYVKDLHHITSTTQPVHHSYEPEIGTVQSGVMIDMQALVSADQKYVTLTLKPQMSNLISMEHVRWSGAPAGRNDLTIQVPHVKTAILDATISIPDRRTVLFRLPYREQPTPTTHPADDDPVYLMVRPSIVIQKDSESLQPSPATQPSSDNH